MLAILILAAASGFPTRSRERAAGVAEGQRRQQHHHRRHVDVGAAYLLKVPVGAVVDRYSLPLLGRRRGWMLAMQLALGRPHRGDPRCSTRASPWHRSPSARSRSCSSPRPRTCHRAYRADVSLPSERGLAAAAANLRLPFGLLDPHALAVALVIADHFGWRLAFLILAAAMALFAVATVRAPASHNTYQPRSLRESVVAPLRELLGHAERPDAARPSCCCSRWGMPSPTSCSRPS